MLYIFYVAKSIHLDICYLVTNVYDWHILTLSSIGGKCPGMQKTGGNVPAGEMSGGNVRGESPTSPVSCICRIIVLLTAAQSPIICAFTAYCMKF